MPRRARSLGVLLVVTLAVASEALAQGFTRDPVFLVHGHGQSSSVWISLMDTLLARGYPPEFLRAIDLIPNTGGNRTAAEAQIAPAIEGYLADVNAALQALGYTGSPKTRVDLIGYSMGAVSTRYYAAVVAPHRVDTWISVAGANHGTDALCPYIGTDAGGADELCPAYSTDPEDTAQLTLNGAPGAGVDETPFGLGVDAAGVAVVPPDAARRVFYATIRTESDIRIVPDDSALVDGAGGRPIVLPEGFPAVETSPGNFTMTHGVSHGSMPGDFWVQQLVTLLLDAVDPPPPPATPPGRMSGLGHVDDGGVRHHFDFRVVERVDGSEAGRLEYHVAPRGPRHERRLGRRIPDGSAAVGHQRFASTTVTAVAFSDDLTLEPGRRPAPLDERRLGRRIGEETGVIERRLGRRIGEETGVIERRLERRIGEETGLIDTVVFRGVGRWNGAPGYTFEARASDGGEPGRGRDSFGLMITAPDGSVVVRVDGRLAGGNVQSRRLRLSP